MTRTALMLSALILLPLSSGCMLRSYEPSVPRPEASDDIVALETSSEDDDTLAVALASDSPTGHLFGSSSVTVIRPDAQRVGASFDSQGTATHFAELVEAHYARGGAVRARTESVIPLFYGTEERRVLSENAFYNEQVELADQDRNGVITGVELRHYHRSVRQ